jgi:hypothetical protein
MRLNGVRTLLAVALAVALLAATADAAVAPPKCWKGRAGCTHTATPYWTLTSFEGTATVVGTRPKSLTCADVANGPRAEIIAGRYAVEFTLRPRASDTRVPANAQKLPTTSKPLALSLRATGTTHEQVRTLTPTGDGQGCVETLHDCDRSATTTVADELDVFVRGRRVVQETPGDFIQSRFPECSGNSASPSLLPKDALDGKFMSEESTFSAFRHRDTVVTHGRDRQIGDGSTSIELSGRLTYARSIHACTRYPRTKPRCRDARG